MELSFFVPPTSTLFALRVLLGMEVFSLVTFCFGSGEGGWEFFHFFNGRCQFLPTPLHSQPFFFSPPSVDAVASVDGFLS